MYFELEGPLSLRECHCVAAQAEVGDVSARKQHEVVEQLESCRRRGVDG